MGPGRNRHSLEKTVENSGFCTEYAVAGPFSGFPGEDSGSFVELRPLVSVVLSTVVEISPLHQLRPQSPSGGSMSVIAFHEKAGRSQGDSFWTLLVTLFLPAESPLSPPFHPHSSRSALVRSVQVGCSRFSRCCHLIIDLGSISTMKAGPGV